MTGALICAQSKNNLISWNFRMSYPSCGMTPLRPALYFARQLEKLRH